MGKIASVGTLYVIQLVVIGPYWFRDDFANCVSLQERTHIDRIFLWCRLMKGFFHTTLLFTGGSPWFEPGPDYGVRRMLCGTQPESDVHRIQGIIDITYPKLRLFMLVNIQMQFGLG